MNMQIKIQSIHFDADKSLLEFIQKKIDKLGHYYDGIMGGEVFLRLDKADDTQNKIAEIKIQTRTGDLFAKRQCKSFEEAVIESTEALSEQVKRHKEKLMGI
jgi:putative sigma-54 modulation protein